MKYAKINPLSRYPYSLKSRLYIMLTASSIIPLILIGTISVYAIYSILVNKIDKGIENNIEQVSLSLENTLENMNYTSQQFTFNGLIGQDVYKYLRSDDLVEKIKQTNMINHNIALMNYTNPIVGMTLYYDKKNQTPLFTNMQTEDFQLKHLPLLTTTQGSNFYGPHESQYKNSNNNVFSLSRKFDITNDEQTSNVIIYIESNFSAFENILTSMQYGMEAFHILVNSNGKVIYTGNEQLILTGSDYDLNSVEGYKAFSKESDQNWRIVTFIDQNDYGYEIRKWLYTFLLFALLSLLCSIFIAVLIRKIVYKPLNKINQGIAMISGNNLEVKMNFSGVREFDSIISEFNNMTNKIKNLVKKVELEEKNKSEVEIEKLMAQINPHFLYNSLNTIQWLSRMREPEKTDRFVALFIKLLNYNLAKGGYVVPIKEEINTLLDYIELQNIRYDNIFDVEIEVDEQAWDYKTPRFLLQPLVENALYHGLEGNEGSIKVYVTAIGNNKLSIVVIDDGKGMVETEIADLLTGRKKKYGLGIGLNYVDKMIKIYFGPSSRLDISSEENKGTKISITLLYEERMVDHD
ncbi:histidine kinase [Gracilibacillus sp. D59]|uniref:sensor histidine kinase n=1 Tax=Gracilibacillus sp. D59 TaxID=3457434 RepID=UPI003FCC7246